MHCVWVWEPVCLLLPSGISSLGPAAKAASPTVEQALKLAPIQDGVDYDRPSPEEAAKCKILAKKFDGHVGWVIENADGVILRKFVDTNGDNVVDQWSYYKDGVEVYRDIDSDFNGKADQYRWFHSGGTRWGIDKRDAENNETGKIGAWKVISAEEVTAEVVAALANKDVERFTRLLLSPEELRSLGLGGEGRRPGGENPKAESDFRPAGKAEERHAANQMAAIRRHQAGHRAGRQRRLPQGIACL